MSNPPERKIFTGLTWFFPYVVGMLFSVSLYASTGAVKLETTDTDGTLVYRVEGANAVVITGGIITAAEGQSVKLLPGTHIKGNEKVTISIVSREHQESRANEAEKKRRQDFYAAVFTRLKDAQTLAREAVVTRFPGRFPFSGTSLAQYRHCISALPVQPPVSFPLLCVALQKNISIQNMHNLLVSAFRGAYDPLTSWGNRVETVKVMLC